MKRKFITWNNMQTEWGSCSWALFDADTYPYLTVKTPFGSKSTQLGWHSPDLLARILTREINAQAKCGAGC